MTDQDKIQRTVVRIPDHPVGSTGNQIAVARKRQQGSETIITIVTARTRPFVELYNNGRTTDYPFGYLQVKLDATGKGSGQIMAAAKIRFDKRRRSTKSRASATSTSRSPTSARNNRLLSRSMRSHNGPDEPKLSTST